ncbi:unnamed protein product [Debaryomyces fabryi]|nr:unnamed protein product [Debaryomyces fabryi]
MLKNFSMKKIIIGMLTIGALSVIISLHLLRYDGHDLMEIVKPKYKPPEEEFHDSYDNEEQVEKPKEPERPKALKVSEIPHDERMIIFPKRFEAADLQEYYTKHFENLDDIKGKKHIFQYLYDGNADGETNKSEELSTQVAEETAFHKHAFKVFNPYPNIKGDNRGCSAIENSLNLEVSESKSMQISLEKVVGNFVKQKNEYYRELSPFFQKDIETQLEEHTIENYWYRLAGSSVWLEQYGVHFMVSRVLYSPRGIRNQPILSLSYVQIFNEKWEELENVELIVPTNNPDVGNQLPAEKQLWASIRYPDFLPIPIFHNVNKQDNRFYGPEDPRTILVKNPKGFEEPLVVFNEFHRKSIKRTWDEGQSELTLSIKHYRSMFMGWPWQFQRGKVNVDGLPSRKFDDNLYTRVVELKRHNIPRKKIQKNWSPFISSHDRQIYQHDKLNKNLPDDEPVGQLRGGTQLISINELISSERHKFPQLDSALSNIPKTRDIWIGFARAHLKNCGCGQDIYRPNMVIITKDDNKYKISHITSFVSMDIPVIGWDLNKPNDVCIGGQPNVFIPNGISSWSFKKDDNNQHLGAVDYLTMSFSLADYTVGIIHLRGLLNDLFKLDKKPSYSNHKLFESLHLHSVGYNNDNVNCALQLSIQFCKEYGKKELEKADNAADSKTNSN